MRFTEIDINTIKASKRAHKHELTFKEFLGMGVPCVEVLDHDYRNSNSAQATLIKAAKRWAPNVIVKVRSGRVFLVRTDM